MTNTTLSLIFPHPSLTKTIGKPTAFDIKLLKKQLAESSLRKSLVDDVVNIEDSDDDDDMEIVADDEEDDDTGSPRELFKAEVALLSWEALMHARDPSDGQKVPSACVASRILDPLASTIPLTSSPKTSTRVQQPQHQHSDV